MTDIREGKPSASSFDITWHCSGASNLLLSLPEDVRNTIDEPDEMALRGLESMRRGKLETVNASAKMKSTILNAPGNYQIH